MINAVEIKSAYKYYGTKKDPQIIFNGLDMTVKKDTIYALIGSSGCGKTTLLSSIIGEMYLNSGTVNVMGMEASIVPRSKIGYMPQEINLADDLNLKQLIHFFGRVSGMSNDKIEERRKYLCELLDLDINDESKLIGEFSGGERRRMSLIIALLHQPELLILDEPTVGLDSILRYKVWNFLIDSTKKGHFTAIITTHYIQEAKRAHYIGLIRNGKMLLEDCPTKILDSFNVDSLEEVHLKLSTKQDQLQDKHEISLDKVARKKKPSNHKSFKIRNIQALMIKNFIQLNGIFLYMFLVVLPFVQAFLLYHSFGDITGIKITVVNDEVLDFDECHNSSLRTTFLHNNTCDLNKISCRFIKHLNNSELSYNILSNMDEVNVKETDAVVFFASNYTESYTDLRDNNYNTGDGSIDNSKIQVFLSNTNVFFNYLVKYALMKSTKGFIDELFVDCGMSLKLNTAPIYFQKPIFGSKKFSIREQMGFPLEMIILFSTAGFLSITSVLKDRLEGLWSRSLNAGVSDNELLVAHLITQVIITSIQLIFILTSIVFVFKLENRGDNFIIISLMFLTQFAGTAFGFIISVTCKSFVTAQHIFNFIILSLVYLCDSVCALEGMPKKMQIIVSALPFTIPSRALRHITMKGYGFEHSSVQMSFVILFSWSFIFLTLSWICLKFQKPR